MAASAPKTRPKPEFRIVRALSLVLVATGIAALTQLVATDVYAQWMADRSISHMQGLYASGDERELSACRTQAQRYNRQLAGKTIRGRVLPYDEQLLYRDEPMMAFIEYRAFPFACRFTTEWRKTR